MMLCAIAVSAYVACTNCASTGWISVPCPDCGGSGQTKSIRVVNRVRRSVMVACPSCARGMVKADSKGSGVKRRTCPVCKGNKRIKKTPLTADKKK